MMKSIPYGKMLLALSLSATLAACGGSDSDETERDTNPVSPTPPEPTSYTVQATASDGGSISPSSVSVEEGDTAEFSIATDNGYQISSVSGCGGSLQGDTYTTGAITAACTVDAQFEQLTFTVQASVNEGGQVSPSEQTVSFEQTTTFEFTPETGYDLVSVEGCDGSLDGFEYTTGAITESCQVEGTFARIELTITATASDGGSITPALQQLFYGETGSFIIAADEGYQFDSVQGCLGSMNGNEFTLEPVTDECSVHVEFVPKAFQIEAFAGDGGAVSPASQALVWGERASVTITPEPSFEIEAITGCDGELEVNDEVQVFVTAPIESQCSIDVTFHIELDAPELTDLVRLDSSFMVAWAEVENAQHYNLYMATEQGVTADNYATLHNGRKLEGVESPLTVGDLENETTYFITVVAYAYEFASNGSEEQFVTPQAPFEPIGGLNDVGIMHCNDNSTTAMACPVEGFEGQSGDTGRDALARDGKLEKVGGGAAGFDFTKINRFGGVLPTQDATWSYSGSEAEGSRWSCVRDNVTGHYWLVASDRSDDPFVAPLSGYWYDPNGDTNGGDPGRQGNDHTNDSLMLTTKANDMRMCGYTDWRLPTPTELYSLINFSGNNTLIDTAYFPDMPSGSNQATLTSVSGARYDSQKVAVNFADGLINSRNKGLADFIRLVRTDEEL